MYDMKIFIREYKLMRRYSQSREKKQKSEIISISTRQH